MARARAIVAGVIVVAVVVLGGGRGARAEEARPGPVQLAWSAPAPPACPRGDDVVADATRILAGSSSKRQVVARATVVRRAPSGATAWHLTLTTRVDDAPGERALDAGSCSELARATALILALSVDPAVPLPAPPATPSVPASAAAAPSAGGNAARPAPGGAPVPSVATPPGAALPGEASPPGAAASSTAPAPAPSPPRPLSSPASPASSPRSSASSRRGPVAAAAASTPAAAGAHRLGVSAAAALDAGALPAVGAGATAGVAWLPRRARIEAAVAAFGAQSTTLSDRAAGGDFHLVKGSLRGCARWPLGGEGSRVELGPCAALTVVSLAASGFGARTTLSGSAAWLEGALGAGAALRFVDALALIARADVALPFARPTYVIAVDGAARSLHRPAAFGGSGMLGVELRFF